jgi:hypothetical protein
VREIFIRISIEFPASVKRVAVWILLLYRKARYGYEYRRIKLTQGQYAIVDTWRYDELSQYKWYAHKGKTTYYAYRAARTGEKRKCKNIKMHHEVMKLRKAEYRIQNTGDSEWNQRLIVDHKNGDGRDNREVNLRLADYSQNSQNRGKVRRRCRSRYKGVGYSERLRKWRAQICFRGRKKHLGYYADEAEAARAYDRAARRYHGRFARLNFREQGTGDRGQGQK